MLQSKAEWVIPLGAYDLYAEIVRQLRRDPTMGSRRLGELAGCSHVRAQKVRRHYIEETELIEHELQLAGYDL
jgi:hypothetical protein